MLFNNNNATETFTSVRMCFIRFGFKIEELAFASKNAPGVLALGAVIVSVGFRKCFNRVRPCLLSILDTCPAARMHRQPCCSHLLSQWDHICPTSPFLLRFPPSQLEWQPAHHLSL